MPTLTISNGQASVTGGASYPPQTMTKHRRRSSDPVMPAPNVPQLSSQSQTVRSATLSQYVPNTQAFPPGPSRSSKRLIIAKSVDATGQHRTKSVEDIVHVANNGMRIVLDFAQIYTRAATDDNVREDPSGLLGQAVQALLYQRLYDSLERSIDDLPFVKLDQLSNLVEGFPAAPKTKRKACLSLISRRREKEQQILSLSIGKKTVGGGAHLHHQQQSNNRRSFKRRG